MERSRAETGGGDKWLDEIKLRFTKMSLEIVGRKAVDWKEKYGNRQRTETRRSESLRLKTCKK